MIKPIQQETADKLIALMNPFRITDIFDNIMTPKGIYMIYVEGQDSPKRRHLTFEDAQKEAERLARAMRKKTYILGTIECVEVNDIVRTNCAVDQLPW